MWGPYIFLSLKLEESSLQPHVLNEIGWCVGVGLCTANWWVLSIWELCLSGLESFLISCMIPYLRFFSLSSFPRQVFKFSCLFLICHLFVLFIWFLRDFFNVIFPTFILSLKESFLFEIVLDLQKYCQMSTESLHIPQHTSPNVNILLDHNVIIKTKKLTLEQFD